jgi:hypothetical protein
VRQTAVILLAAVSAIFVAKYAVRLGAPGLFSGALYFTVFVGSAAAALQIASRSATLLKSRSILIATCCLALLALIGILVLSPTSRVGRLPAITVWLSDLLAGSFPYHAPNQPSGFPVLFVLALPAYLLGNSGLLEVAGVAFFGVALWKMARGGMRVSWVPFLLLLLLPSFYYEVAVRSELFFNMSLVLALVLFSEEWLAPEKKDRTMAAVAILFGLALSTRAIVGLVYIVYVLWRFRGRPFRGAAFSLTVLMTFLITLVPFILWDSGLFLSNGPFSIQLGYLPPWIIVVFLVAAGAAGLLVRDRREMLFASGALLFSIVFIAFLFSVVESGLVATLSRDRFDIAYFVFCTPFLLVSLNEV